MSRSERVSLSLYIYIYIYIHVGRRVGRRERNGAVTRFTGGEGRKEGKRSGAEWVVAGCGGDRIGGARRGYGRGLIKPS